MTATNIGEGQANGAILTLFCSRDAVVSNDDEVVTNFPVTPLAAGASTNYEIPVTAYTNISTNYYAFCLELVLANYTTKLAWSEPISIVVSETPLPDLSVFSFTMSDNAISPGDAFTLMTRIRNSGLVMAAEKSTLTFYRSDDSTIGDADDTQVGMTPEIPALSNGASMLYSEEITAPDIAGTYYYGACISPVTGEANTENNCSVGTMMVVVRPLEYDLMDLTNNQSYGLWSDGTTIWVADDGDDKIYAYNLETKARDSDKDFNTLTSAGNNKPAGLWSDFETMWVVDSADAKIYAYNLSNKARDNSKDFNNLADAGNNYPVGLWSDCVTLWVADYIDAQVYAYNFSTGERDSEKDFNTLSDAENNHPRGIWSDDTSLWVVDDSDDYIYAYTLTTGERNSSKDVGGLAAAGNRHARGLWSEGITMWVSDRSDQKLYAYGVSNLVDRRPDIRVFDFTVNGEKESIVISPDDADNFFISLSTRVRNRGLANADSTTITYYRSDDSIITTNDTPVGSDVVPSLSSGAAASFQNNLNTSVETFVAYGACVSVVSGEINTANNCSTGVTVTLGWIRKTASAGWTSRFSHASVVFDDKMWVLGGRTSGIDNSVWSSSDGINWTKEIAHAGWSDRYGLKTVVFENKMWISGGNFFSSNQSNTFYNDVWSSSDGTNWTEETSSAGWPERSYHTVVVFDDKMWVLGGSKYWPWPPTSYNDVWSSSDGINWTRKTANAGWSPRSRHTSVVFNDKMWVLGGQRESISNVPSPIYNNEVWSSSNGVNWTEETSSAPWSPRNDATLVVFDDKMWILGGHGGGNKHDTTTYYNDVWCSSDGINWTKITDAGWSPMAYHTSVVFDDKMWVLGGRGDGFSSKNSEVWSYSLD